MQRINKKIIFSIVFVVVMMVPVLSNAAKWKKEDYVGKKFYLQTNMWNESSKHILSTNYHRGEVIPLGSSVTVLKMNKKMITFKVNETEVQYTLVLSRKHSVLDIVELFERYFGEVNPVKNRSYKSLNKRDRGYVESGVICSDMTKEAVVLAYGYPPTHRTPSLKTNEWNYWESRMRRVAVFFKNDKVVRVKGYNYLCEE